MDARAEHSAWLETVGGGKAPIDRPCSIGRSKNNGLVLEGEKISRRHALIHPQGAGEYWLADCGSANGTRLNGIRVALAKPLRDGDEIEIGGFRLRFRMKGPAAGQLTGPVTALETRRENCWLLIADIVDSTVLVKQSDVEAMSLIFGRWLFECKERIEECGGTVNKFLGDGLLAFWSEGADEKVARTLGLLKKIQDAGKLDFRVALHYGEVSVGGMPTNSEESLLGPEVHFIFRVEKVAAALGARRCVTEAAAARLREWLTLEELGEHRVPGFDGARALFTFQ